MSGASCLPSQTGNSSITRTSSCAPVNVIVQGAGSTGVAGPQGERGERGHQGKNTQSTKFAERQFTIDYTESKDRAFTR